MTDMTHLSAFFVFAALSACPDLGITITFDAKVNGHFNGRVFVNCSREAVPDQPPRPKWINTDPLYAMDVKDWKPGEPLQFRPTFGFPHGPKDQIKPGTYYLQAILDRDQGGQNAVAAPGNAYSQAVKVEIKPGMITPVQLNIDRIIPDKKFVESERVKLATMPSPLLSKFHGKPMSLRAGVLLPPSFAKEPERKFPIIFEIPGFGGDHHGVFAAETRKASEVAGTEMIHVVLDPACRTGHHVFADSANNGPYGQALVEEFIPHLEAKFRGTGKPRGRFVTGHSSGGWSSLWLQTRYPDFFGGVWSTAPDPVDFRDFQKVDIYPAGTNIYKDEKGEARPIGRKGDKAILFYEPFCRMEEVFGRGGQLLSFEAVFSPKGKDGQPVKLWDRQTGKIDPAVAKTWEPYDIRMNLEKNWATLGPKLARKIHVYMGEKDTFYLEGATKLLRESLKKLGSDAVIEIFPGKDHGTLLDADLRKRIAKEMSESWRNGTK